MTQRPPLVVRGVAVLLTLAAALGTVVAWVTYRVFCFEDDGGIPCLGRRAELVWQLVTAILGLCAAVTMLVLILRSRRRLALWAFVLALLLYALSFWLSDAAVHGWDDLKYFPRL
jgi:cytochrome bd-type quinol oxidase subunit 2